MTRSGTLLVIDTGYLKLWSHDRPPLMPPGGLDSEEHEAFANTFVDMEIVGPDAEEAGRRFGFSWHPLYIYDQPPKNNELKEKFEKLARENRLKADLREAPRRVPHLQRLERALYYGHGAGEFQFHGLWAVAAAGAPREESLRVVAERSQSDPYRWKQVSIECRPAEGTLSAQKIGDVMVDYARLLIADPYALGNWKHLESIDGLADYVFWGRDAEQVANSVGAPHLNENEFGWLSLPEEKAIELGEAVEKLKDQKALKFAADFRPHSDHWRVMTPTRQSQTDSAFVEVEGTQVCNFMTSWGDGLFAVYRDLTDAGDLVRIRISLEPDDDSAA